MSHYTPARKLKMWVRTQYRSEERSSSIPVGGFAVRTPAVKREAFELTFTVLIKQDADVAMADRVVSPAGWCSKSERRFVSSRPSIFRTLHWEFSRQNIFYTAKDVIHDTLNQGRFSNIHLALCTYNGLNNTQFSSIQASGSINVDIKLTWNNL